ncbi:MAG: hypothetical protein ABIQ18_41215 [Umezawaea sp.]
MGQVNTTSNLFERIKNVERRVNEVYKKVGLASATITKGGLTLLQDAFLRMADDLGVEVLYVGPDSLGRQIFRIRREGGSTVFYTAFTTGGDQFWRLTDRFSRELFSDDTTTGGMARPYLSVPMVPLFSMAASSLYGYMNIAASTIATEQTIWEGRIPLVSHPFISVAGIWGQASGSNTSTYRLKISGTEVGSWSATTLENANKGPFNISSKLDQVAPVIQLTATASGTGQVGAMVYGCWLRQTPS